MADKVKTNNPRIETAEVLSFRLKVPPTELARLPDQLGKELNLAIETEGPELVLSMEDAESYLRFRPIGPEAILTEIFLANDDRGLFFQRVLGALMVRYGGDLHIRLTWNTPERNAHGEFAEVRINRGSTTYPGLANSLAALPAPVILPSSGAGSGGQQPAGAAQQAAGGDEAPETERPLTPLEQEISELLTRARANWEEYQRLKAAKKP